MGDFPIMLKVSGRLCVVVGGGEVAARRVRSLLEAGARVTVIAPDVVPALTEPTDGLTVRQTPYQPGDLQRMTSEMTLVIVATDDPTVNEQVQADAGQLGALVNRADEPDAGDFTVPAHARHGPLTLAVHTGGASAAAAAVIRRQLSSLLDPDWPTLLEAAAKYRPAIQKHVPDVDRRRERLKQLTDDHAMHTLKTRGLTALHEHLEKLASP